VIKVIEILLKGVQEAAEEVYPHVYSSSGPSQGSIVSQSGSKYMLPIGTDRQVYEVGSSEYRVLTESSSNTLQEYEEVIIPPAKPIPPKADERLMPVSELEELVKGCFTVILESPHR
jgi:antiviral helicase SLH1